jgi:hypothetical protein
VGRVFVCRAARHNHVRAHRDIERPIRCWTPAVRTLSTSNIPADRNRPFAGWRAIDQLPSAKSRS